ncbi:MAG TPA: excinuclease ABC subunit UvrC [Cytophagaceae bacterium]|jgi:excinuclease ABC subunit C|nr:excinuclease ABC subunit UvrC [Cytophagaceae bacterium]
MSEERLKNSIKNLPEKPGVYRYFNTSKELIYVGKAKDIRKRVTSYFSRIESLDIKTRKLVSQIDDIEYTIVNTEFDALILENTLIKEHQPKYNILLRDDKTYPYILLTNERFPRVVTTRKIDKNLGAYFGPYTSVGAMNTVVELVNKIFQLRTCALNLSEKKIAESKYKVCLEYHLGNCKGPCEGLDNEEEYLNKVKLTTNILKGNINPVRNYFREHMQEASSKLEFEKAEYYRTKLESLDRFHKNSVVVSPSIENLSVFTIVSDEKYAVVNYLKIINGLILQSKTIDIKKKLNEEDSEILVQAIVDTREALKDDSREIVLNVGIEYPLEEIQTTIPQKGDKKKLHDLSLKNSTYRLEKLNFINAEDSSKRIMETLQKDLSLKELPDHIECFDNSNFQGTDAVSAMVCFRNAKPSNKDYRHFNVKTVVGANDFATMYEVITRRYKRCIEENLPLPKLIIVDGGKGQLSSAVMALSDLKLYGKIPIIGIAKNLEEIFFPGDEFPIYIDKKSESLRLIQNLRDEAHRFGITHHRNKRSKTSIKSSLEDIPDIGEATIEKLLTHFKSIQRIKASSEEELIEIVGTAKARKIRAHLK